jgi:serine phosphatase RsbU (regulator of sigma subunit)
MLGEDKLDALVTANSALSAENLKTKLLDEIVRFTKGEPQSDDITLIVVKFLAQPS